MEQPIQVFFSYSHRDETLRDELSKHLSILRRQGFINEWHDRQIPPGAEWAGAIDERINRAQVILLLISSDFLASDYCHEIEMVRALERHEKREAVVIPVILRPCFWQGALFGKQRQNHFGRARSVLSLRFAAPLSRRAVPQGRRINIEDYIEYEALGLAVLLSQEGATQTRSVVLIDEIDKAPRDLPNDVLNEIEALEFTVKETGRTFRSDQRYRPIVVLTSNSEKNLPDAFLRRCIFYHIEFPDAARLRKIVERRVRLDSAFTPAMLDAAIAWFEKIRKLPNLKKAPATAELLAWVRILDRLQLDVRQPGAAEALAFSYSALAKNEDDLKRVRDNIK